MLLYRLFLFLYPKIAKILSFFNEKAMHWMEGQEMVWQDIQNKRLQVVGPIIWVHTASYGEFEQGIPIIDALKKQYPEYTIWVTFFSPSGFLHKKNDAHGDIKTYLPFDSEENASKFISVLQPKLIVFIKYEFWYYYLQTAKQNNIPTMLASAIFRKNQIFFSSFGSLHRNMLHCFTDILVQDQSSFDVLSSIYPSNQITITGDTRFDRVFHTSHHVKDYDWMQDWMDLPIIVAGSTWNDDHALIASIYKHIDVRWIIVPHHVDGKSIKSCQKFFNNAILLSQLPDIPYEKRKHYTVIIVDAIGYLRNLYQYAHIAFIGGGFTKDGIHNVLEPAVFGKPVIWGPNDEKYKEAQDLKVAQGGWKVNNAVELEKQIKTLLNNPNYYQQSGQNALRFIESNIGATDKTIHYIMQKGVLKN
jgi:3-deoxy-D-manno-octulosonic-acid transferase